jgi:hypothetical protein
MVINSTNINKANNHLLSYLNSLNTIKTTTNDVGNSHVAGSKISLDYPISNYSIPYILILGIK